MRKGTNFIYIMNNVVCNHRLLLQCLKVFIQCQEMDNSRYIQVIKNINEELRVCELSENIGLHAGTSGIALFLAYYDHIIQKKSDVSQRVMDILTHNIGCINSGSRLHTICSGISGFGWLCEHLSKMEMLSKEDIKFLDYIDPYLYKMMMVDIKKGNYDYLHGALGVGTYFLSRFKIEEVHGYLKELLIEIEKSSITCYNDAVKWISVIDHETGEKGVNISLSHGMSSIAAFLIRLHQLDFETKRVIELLTRTVTYILDQITCTEGSLSCFPSFSKESSKGNYYSRLGWCYGDLGIAFTLLRAAMVLKNEEWEKLAIQVLLHNCNRRNLRENAINDAGLCHGSSGIAHIFWNLYLGIQINEFNDASDFWLNVTLQMAKYSDGLAGFKAWRKEEYGGLIKTGNLLEGIAGIGLALISNLKSGNMRWDECLLLS